MSKELVISSSRHETKLAILEDDQLVEVYFQRSNEYSLAGSIHKGRVTRVLPGMQSAFVDLGLDRDTFLYVSDFFEENDEYDPIAGEEQRPLKPPPPRAQVEAAPVEPVVERPVVEAPPAPPVVEPQAAAPAPLTTERSGEEADRRGGGGGGGDRRGRRSRRRRKGGGGFPDSKYATDVKDEASEEETDLVQAEEEPAEVILLPGESLAKYSRPSSRTESHEPKQTYEKASPEPEPLVAEAPPVEKTAEPAVAAAHAIEDSVLPPDILADFPEPEKIEPPVLQAETLAVHEPTLAHPAEPVVEAVTPAETTVVELAPAVHALPEPAAVDSHEADHPVASHGSPVEEIPALVAHTEHIEEPAPPSEPEVSPDHHHSADELPHLGLGTQTVGESGPESRLEVFEPQDHSHELSEPAESEHSESLELVESHEHEPLSMNDEVLELIEGVEADDAAADGTETEEEPAPQASATVREQGGRFAHRGSRRMRRRNRGANVADSRIDQPQARPEVAAAPPVVVPAPVLVERTRPDRERPPLPSITELLKEGQEIIVQIAKEPLGQKGARITSHIALPGRYVVFMPTLEHLGVSRKVSTDEERLRLKRILQTHRVGIPGGFIVRTAGEGRTEDEIASDMSFLYNLWLDIRQKAERRPAPLLLHHDLDIVQRTLRDQLTEDFKTITVDTEDLYESVLRFVQRFQPSLVGRIKLYTRPAPIFDAFNITAELEKALRPKVWLKSGGYIVINQTEALVAIDVNTGKYVGKSNRLEDTIVKTNTDAVKEIVRQIRLRDLGGIIVIDFIDMDERKNRQKVMQALEEAMRTDRAPYKILQFNDFGLVAITRKRVKQSLERTLCAPCPYCEGAGYVKSVQTIIGEILQEGHKLARVVEGKDVMLRVNPEVAKMLKSNDNKYLEELEETLGRPVLVKSDPTLHHEKFDLV